MKNIFLYVFIISIIAFAALLSAFIWFFRDSLTIVDYSTEFYGNNLSEPRWANETVCLPQDGFFVIRKGALISVLCFAKCDKTGVEYTCYNHITTGNRIELKETKKGKFNWKGIFADHQKLIDTITITYLPATSFILEHGYEYGFVKNYNDLNFDIEAVNAISWHKKIEKARTEHPAGRLKRIK